MWLWMPFNTAFLAFKAFALASALGGAGASFFAFGAIFMKRVSQVNLLSMTSFLNIFELRSLIFIEQLLKARYLFPGEKSSEQDKKVLLSKRAKLIFQRETSSKYI